VIVKLYVPGERPRALRWTIRHAASHYGGGVLLYRHTKAILDGATFRALRDARGAWIETDNPERVARALGVPWQDDMREPGIEMLRPVAEI
jgi:hypothetical protein